MLHLGNGQQFPELKVPRVGGGSLALPRDLAGHFGVVLIYRGSWCPYCRAQLTAFRRASETLKSLDVRVAALSVDDQETSRDLVEQYRLDFPVGHSADAHEIAKITGAHVSNEPGPDGRSYVNSTGFVLTPDSAVITAVYSSGAIGRLVPEDVAGLVRYIRKSRVA